MNKPFKVSVSSAKTFQDCNMKWYLDKVVGVPREDTPALRIGSIFGKILELITKKQPFSYLFKESDVAKELYNKNIEFIHNIPKESQIQAEFELKLKLTEELNFEGYIDALYEEGEGQNKRVIVRDYKTVSDWRWALTDIQLSADEQVNIYAYFIDKKLFGLVPIWLEHIQFNKKTGMRRMVRVPYDREQGKRIYDWIVMSGEDMAELQSLPIEKVEKNWDSCDKFGGCPNRNFCKGQISLEELMNPYVKERSKEELAEMKPEARLEELKKEQEFNKILEKGAKMGTLQEKLKLLKEKNDAKAKETDSVFTNTNTEIKPESHLVQKKEETHALDTKAYVDVATQNVGTKEEVVKKRTRRTKAEIAMAEQSENTFQEPIDMEEVGKKIGTDLGKAMAEDVIKKKQVFVLVGCAFLEEDKNNPSDFLHEKYIAPILKQENIPHISCSEFSKANKSVMLFAQSILNEIYENYDSINIDIRRPVDALVYTMIMDLDVRKDGQKRFKLIRSTF
jgi:hypothetical protein